MSKKSVIFHSSLHKYELGIIILILVNSTCTNNLVFKVFYLFLIGFLLFAAIILSFCSLTFFLCRYHLFVMWPAITVAVSRGSASTKCSGRRRCTASIQGSSLSVPLTSLLPILAGRNEGCYTVILTYPGSLIL